MVYTQGVNQPKHVPGFQIDNVYIKSALLEEFHKNTIV